MILTCTRTLRNWFSILARHYDDNDPAIPSLEIFPAKVQKLNMKFNNIQEKDGLGILQQLISIIQADQEVSRQLETEPAAGHAGCDLQ